MATAPIRGVTTHGEPRPPSRLVVAVITTVVALGLAAAVYGIAVWTSGGQIVDQYVLDAVRRASAVAYVPRPLTVAFVTDPRLWVGAAALAAIGSGIPAIVGRARIGVALARTFALLVFPLIIVVLVRYLREYVLVRPQFHSWIEETSNSAPSGHAAAVSSCVVVLIAASPKWIRPVVAALGGSWAAVIAFGLVADGWHRPSDIVISVLIVIGLGALLPDPYSEFPTPRGAWAFSAAAVLATVIVTPLLVAQSYPDHRQILTAAGIAVVMGVALCGYRPCTYRSRAPRFGS